MMEAAEANAKFRAFFEQGALFAGIMHTDGTIIEPNRLSLEACGYTKEQVVGKFFWDCPWWTRSPTVMEQIKTAWRQAIAGEAYRAEMPYFVADGSERVVDFILLPIKDESGRVMFLAPTGTDVTDRKQAERELAEALRFYHSSIDALLSHIAVLDENGVILEVNDAWRRFANDNEFVGFNCGVGTNYVELCETTSGPCADDGTIARGLKDVLASREEAFEIEYPCHSPTEDRWFLMRVSRFKSSGPVRAVVSHENVTKRRQAEEALRQADRRKDEFLATLAHELRNPLAPLQNALQVLQLKGPAPREFEWARDLIARQVQQMTRLLEDLLDVSRISRGRVMLKRERVELAHVVQGAVDTSRPLIEQLNHELTITLPPGPIVLDADTTRLVQVFANLLNNAAKYTDRGGRISLTVERQGGDVIVSVRDDGIGVRADQLRIIFEMFLQVESALSRSQGGLGIGLTLVKRLVEMHGGTVEARSEGIGQGSEFVVRLPVVVEASQTAAPVMSDPRVVVPVPLRVLIVDDSRDGAESMAMLMQLMGHEARIAYDGEEGVQSAAEFLPHLALLDIGLPKLNGYEACRRIREQPWGKRMVVVAVTGWGQEEDRRKAEEAGFHLHLVKPVDPEALVALLRSVAQEDAE